MTERSEIAKLYSRARGQGARYGDYSASRMQVRGHFRQRIAGQPTDQGAPAEGLPLPPSMEQNTLDPQPSLLSQPQEGSATRWHALHSLLGPAHAEQPLDVSRNPQNRPPLLIVLSLAGGVGKTCLVATLGRALAGLGEHVLLADTAVCGMLPFYFGARDFRPGVVRTFAPPVSCFQRPAGSCGPGGCPVQVLNLQAERYPGESREQDPLLEDLLRDGHAASRILVDVATANRDVTSRLLLLQPMVLVPVLPDISSVASLGLLRGLLQDEPEARATTRFLLNQFDASLPLHVDMRALLQQQLGDRLLPFVVRRSSAVSEALAEGMTVIDYAPDSEAAEDYGNLAIWLRNLSSPALHGHAGARWSER